MDFLTGIDIGNAKTEVAFLENGIIKTVRQPSVISFTTELNTATEMDEKHLVNTLLDNLLVQVVSKGLEQNGLYFVGKKALNSNGLVRNMNIDLSNKSENDIPLITSLSMIAAIGIQKEYETKNSLPKKLTINVDMGTALPSSEYSDPKTAKLLHSRFSGEHDVTIYIGEELVKVTINIVNVKVTEEGRTAMLAFLNSDPSILRHYNETYGTKATPADFSEARSLHSDIGDGTSEFVYTEGYYPVPNSSQGLGIGVGHATETAINSYRKANKSGVISRQEFVLLLDMNSQKGNLAREKMDMAKINQAMIISDTIQASFAKLTGSNADYFFVHGGGSIVFKELLYDKLIKLAEASRGQVVWIPEEFATHMNSLGCFYLAESMFGNK